VSVTAHCRSTSSIPFAAAVSVMVASLPLRVLAWVVCHAFAARGRPGLCYVRKGRESTPPRLVPHPIAKSHLLTPLTLAAPLCYNNTSEKRPWPFSGTTCAYHRPLPRLRHALSARP